MKVVVEEIDEGACFHKVMILHTEKIAYLENAN
jgi:hypothetical protein